MEAHEFYLFRVRDPVSGKWGQTRYKITHQTAHERYGEGSYECIKHTREARTIYAEGIAFDKYINRSSG